MQTRRNARVEGGSKFTFAPQILILHIFVALIPNLKFIFLKNQVLASPRPTYVGQNTKNASGQVLSCINGYRVVEAHLKSD